MKILKKLIALTLFVAMIFQVQMMVGINVSASENLINNISSNNWGMYAVPALGEIKIDATFDDWDWSPRIKMFADYEAIATNSAEVCVNYDAENIYWGAIVKDQTPLNNTVDPELEYTITWTGDSFQLRFGGDHLVWATLAYHKLTDQYSMFLVDLNATATQEIYSIMYTTDPGGTKFTRVQEHGSGGKRPFIVEGMEMCAKQDSQVDGITVNYELKIPKGAFFYETSEPFKAGDIIQMGIECYWSNDSGRGQAMNYKDNLQAGSTNRDFFFWAYKDWGNVTFLAENNIEVRQYVKDYESPMSGYFKINVEVDKNAEFLTVTIDDETGYRIRNLIAELEVGEGSAYVIEEKANSKIVEVLWDGRDNVGMKVSPGTYYINGITHEGVKPIYEYTFYSPSKIPWRSSNPTSSWLADHSQPEGGFAFGDEVYFGAHFAEAGQGLLAYDPKTQSKKWGITYGGKLITANEKYLYAQPGATFTFSSNITGNAFIARYNRADGTYAPVSVFGEQQVVEYANDKILGINNGQTTALLTGIAASDEIFAIASADNHYPTARTGYPEAEPKYKNYISGISLLRHDDFHVYKRIAVEDVGQICFTKDYKHLYAASGNRIVEVNVTSGEVTPLNLKLGADVEIGPIGTDNDHNIMIFDRGADCQIKVFNPNTGDLVYTIGKKGGRSYDGKYDPNGFIRQVTAITAGYDDRIWVVENFHNPRRISEWSRDGELLFDMVGNAEYGGSGTGIHEQDPTRAYFYAVEMKIDRENDTYKADRVLYVPDISKGELFPISGGHHIQEYFHSDASGEMHNYVWANRTMYIEGEDGRYRPCFRAGTVSDFLDLVVYKASFQWYDDEDLDGYLQYWKSEFAGCESDDPYIWNDENCDGIVSREECEIYSKYGDNYITGSALLYDATGAPLRNMWGGLQYIEDILGQNRGSFGQDAYIRDANNNLVDAFQTQADGVKRNDDLVKDATFAYWGTSDKYYRSVPDIPNRADWDQRVRTDTLQWSGFGINKYGIWTPVEFKENGAPVYTMDNLKTIELGFYGGSILFENSNMMMSMLTWPSNVFMDAGVKGIDTETGELKWVYRNDYPGVHGSHGAGMQEPYGVIIGTLKMLGTFHNSKGDQFTVIRGNQGCDYVITTDGYYVATVFKDNRLVANAIPDDMKPGYDMSGFTEGGEPFGGSGSTQDDGVSRYITAIGGTSGLVVRLDGMDTIEHIKTIPFKVTMKELEACYAYVEPEVETIVDPSIDTSKYQIKYTEKGFKLDGASDDWEGYNNVRVETDGATEYADVKLAWNEENLYAIFSVRDDSPMVNGAPEFVRLFKFGDVCDINLSETANGNSKVADGDLRIMLSVFQGEPIAVLLKQVDSNATGTETAQFSSPVSTVNYDTVRRITDAEVIINITDTGYVLEAKIPWTSIGYSSPNENSTMTGDVGIVTGDSDGTRNLARIYYFNKDTGLTSDIPAEAQCYPGQWGGITFSKEDPSEIYWSRFGE